MDWDKLATEIDAQARFQGDRKLKKVVKTKPKENS